MTIDQSLIVSFLTAFNCLLGQEELDGILNAHGPCGRGGVKVTRAQVVVALVCRVMHRVGTLGSHFHRLFGMKVSESTLSERRGNMHWEAFEQILQRALQPRADEATHPKAFYKGLRLVGLDGTKFSATNTPQILDKIPKTKTRRFEAAFAKIQAVVAVELGLHNPIGAVVSYENEGEITLARRLFSSIPSRSLVVVDRAFGCGAFINSLLPTLKESESALLVRVKLNLKSVVKEVLSDGSALVDVPLYVPGTTKKTKESLTVREIRARVKKAGEWVTVRFWTTLLDEHTYPARELLEIYALRWEQEIAFRELKIDMRSTSLLVSQTPETARQEIAALLIAQAILVNARISVAASESSPEEEQEVLRISFSKVLDALRGLWPIIAFGEDIISDLQIRTLVERVIVHLNTQVSSPRRARSCPRKLRQPVSSFPRLLNNSYHNGEPLYEILDPIGHQHESDSKISNTMV